MTQDSQLVVELVSTSEQTVEISQLEAAERQIDRAIELHIQGDYVCAVTLACAAESMLGEHLGTRGIESITAALKLSLNNLVPSLSLKEINDKHLNNVRNFLKHRRGDPHVKEVLALAHESVTALIRATGNFTLMTNRLTASSEQFYAWLRGVRPTTAERAKDVAL